MMSSAFESRPPARQRVPAQLVFLLFCLAWAPLPLASNRPWAVAILACLLALLAAWTLVRPPAPVAGRDGTPIRRARWALALTGAWVALLGLQLLPLPAGLAAALGYAADGPFAWGREGALAISIDPYSTRVYLVKAAALALFFWLLLAWVDTAQRLELLVRVLVASGLFQAVLGIALYAAGAQYTLFFVDVDHLGGAQGTFINRDHLAGYLEMTLALGIGLMIAKLEDRHYRDWRQRLRGWLAVLLSGKAILRLALVVMVIGLIATHSRMGNAAFFASLLAAGLAAMLLSRHATRATVVFIASLVVLDVVIIGSVVGIERVLDRIEATHMSERAKLTAMAEARDAGQPAPRREQTLEERIQPGLHTAAVVRDFPWLGTGGGTYHAAFMAYRPEIITLWYDHAHNDYMELAADTGLVGLALLGGLVLASAALAVTILVRRRDPFARGMAFASLMGMLALLIHGTVDFNLQIPANAMLFIVIIALPYLVGWQTHIGTRV